MLRPLLLPLAAAAALVPATADAATTVGALAPAGSTNGQTRIIDTTNFQVSTPIATAGVITGWSVQEGTGPFDPAADRAALRIFRPNPGGSYTLVAAGADEPMRAPFANVPARIPVQAGDLLGMRMSSSSYTGALFTFADPSATLGQVGGDPQPGEVVTPLATSAGWRLNVTANVEADADADGFGDETQDACPTSAATQGACPAPPPPPPPPPADRIAPQLTLPKLVKQQKVRRGYVALRVASTEAATVKVTARRGTRKLAPVTVLLAPGQAKTVKVKLGKRARPGKVAVTLTARDAAGNVSTLKRTITLTR